MAPSAIAVTTMAVALSGSAAGASTSAVPGAATSTAGTSVTTDTSALVRMVTKGASLPAQVGKPLGKPAGIESPELRAGGRGNVLRHSLSPRPSAFTTFATGLRPPIVTSSAVGGSPGLGQSWNGLNGFQQRYANNGNQFSVEPPDQAMCVGNDFALEATNDVLRVFRTSGAAATGVVDLNSFYGYKAQVNRTPGAKRPYGPFVTDPVCAFDHGSGRFFVAVLTLDVDPASGGLLGSNHLDLAVSRTDNPTRGFDIYRLPVQDDGTQGTPKHTDCPCIGDYPHIGTDGNAVFLTTNEYPFAGKGSTGVGYNGAQIYAFDKRALAAGSGQVRVVQFQNTSLANGRTAGFTVWPAVVPDSQYATAKGGTEYFLSSVAAEEASTSRYNGMANQIGQYAVTNTQSIRSANPNLHLQGSLLQSETYGVAPRSSQKVGPVPLRDCLAVNCLDILGVGAPPDPNEAEGPLDSGDSRMQQVYYSGGKLYGALDTVMQVQGSLQAGIAWFAVHPGSTPATSSVARQGYVGVAHNNVNYPALAVLTKGTGVMAFTLVGRNYYPTSAYVHFGGNGTGAVHIAAMGRAPQDGFSEYNAFGSPPRPRWGDYGSAVTYRSSVYIASEYIAHRCTFAQYQHDPTCGNTRAPFINWATRISHITP